MPPKAGFCDGKDKRAGPGRKSTGSGTVGNKNIQVFRLCPKELIFVPIKSVNGSQQIDHKQNLQKNRCSMIHNHFCLRTAMLIDIPPLKQKPGCFGNQVFHLIFASVLSTIQPVLFPLQGFLGTFRQALPPAFFNNFGDLIS